MADKYLKDFDAESPNLTDYIIMTGGTGNDSDYKALTSAMAKLLIETYAGSTLGGSARSVQSAIAYVVDELSQRLALTTGDRTSIPTGSDLNTYTTIGNYKITTGTIASNIEHTPVALAGMLIVLTTSDAAKWHQYYIANINGGGVRIFCRSKTSSSGAWSDWFELTYRYTFDSAPTASSTNPVTSGGVYTAIGESADDLMEKIAPAYSSTATYKVGDLCAYNGTIYKCSVEITTAEEWTEAHWEATNITDNLSDISEYVNSTYVSDIPLTTYSGTTRQSVNGKLKIYGTAGSPRNLLFLNGQDVVKISSDLFSKTLDAGTYLIDFHMTGYRTTGSLRGTYTTFGGSNPFTIVTGTERTAIYTFTQPVMIGLYLYSGNDYGTESDPTYITVDAYKLTARDDVARGRIEEVVAETYVKLTTKADTKGAYSDLTAGSAEVILSDSYTEDSVPYRFRQTPVNSKRMDEKIIGGTVAWNQLMRPFESTYYTQVGTGSSYTLSETEMVVAVTGETSTCMIGTQSAYRTTFPANHVLLTVFEAKQNRDLANAYSASPDATTVGSAQRYQYDIFEGAPVGEWFTKAYMVKRASGITNFGIRFAAVSLSPLAQGDEVSIRNLMSFDLTTMFGTTIADYIYGLETATAGAGVALFKSMLNADYYEYNSGELKSVEGLSAHVTRDSDSNIIGNYPLDDSLTLRGVAKLVDNNIKFDGDVYAPNGTVTRRYGVRTYQIGDESLTDTITDGTTTVYKLATATTENAEPYQEIQICNPDGTEEYVSTGIVPIGHETKYYKDIISAIEGIPDAPNANGTYVLKCTVSNGVATYSWVTQ